MKVFISHATANDVFVTQLRERLEPYGIASWTDSRELTPGDLLQPSIQKAIEEADCFFAILSFAAVNSAWVKKEIDAALKVKQARADGFKIVPLLRDGIKPSALALWFGEEPIAVEVGAEPDALDRALPDLLAAVGLVLPRDKEPPRVIPEKPVAELVLELSDPAILQEEGKRRAVANATLTYLPADTAVRSVTSKRYRLTAPLGPIETGELTWYLEHYWHWPTSVYQERAERIEGLLPQWGKLLYNELRNEVARDTFAAWEAAGKAHERRVTVRIDRALVEGSDEEAQAQANEAATLLLAIPWELLHDAQGYLFQGANGMRVRRQLPNRSDFGNYTTNPPIRVLLISPRPEDKRASYIDHRVSARPVVEALAPLGELAHLTLLTPPTFDALSKELVRAKEADTPYHVVHFDGHGVYDPQHGLGALCFEEPQDTSKLTKRRSALVDAEKIAEAIRDCRVPLFFLEACQSAQSDKDPTSSVAGKLLEGGVASVIAMTHSVLVETARRFVGAFYREALHGARVGQAMRKGQQALKDDDWRGKSFVGDFRLQDWFVPVLYQEAHDPQLVASMPSQMVQAELAKANVLRLGKLPEEPPQTFVGRSRELLAAERLLERQAYVVVVGQGGEGKTTLACELARWLVQTNRYKRAAFVSFEQTLTAEAALSLIGDQLVPNYQSKAGQGGNRGWLEVERALLEQPTIVVLDNLESILKPPEGSPGAAAFEPEVLEDILSLCERLQQVGRTRLVFTSRETLPAPFAQNTIGLGRLSKQDALDLVARTLGEGKWLPEAGSEDANEAAVERLVEAAGYHARALVLLTQEIHQSGVKNATAHFSRLMERMEAKHPGERENSLLASVQLSLARLPEATRQRIRPLGVFQGGASLTAIAAALHIEEEAEAVAIGQHLVEVGLAEMQAYGYLRFDPALAPALLLELNEEEKAARQRWAETMQAFARFLYEQQFSDPQFAFGLTAYELPNLLAALEHLAAAVGATEKPTAEAAAAVVEFATQVEQLAQALGRVRAVTQMARIREAVAPNLAWRLAAFVAESATIERLLEAGRIGEAVAAARTLLQRSEQGGEGAYAGADYNLAMAHFQLGRALHLGGAAGAALAPLVEAERRFTLLAQAGNQSAARMVSATRTGRADCLRSMGRLDEAARLYERSIQDGEQRGDLRSAAVGRGQLGSVRLQQRRYPEALQAYQEARETFAGLGEPRSVAAVWHQTGIVYRRTGDYVQAERACQESLRIEQQLGNRTGQADTLVELGILYKDMNRREEAVRFHHEAMVIYIAMGDVAGEGRAHSNAAISLIALGRFDEARRELERAIECRATLGHAAEPWKTFALLHNLEKAVGNEAAASVAWQQARGAYLAYRRDGGENLSGGGRIFAAVAQALAGGQEEAAAAELREGMNEADTPDYAKRLIPALLRVVAGERDLALAEDPTLDYDDAAELRLLLESLA